VDALKIFLTTVPKVLPGAALFVRADVRALTRAQVQHAWNKAREAVGLPQYHFHDIRHSGLTLNAQSGATVRELMQRAGHSTSAASLKYQHVAQERGREIAGGMDAVMRGLNRA
jgi:integrase